MATRAPRSTIADGERMVKLIKGYIWSGCCFWDFVYMGTDETEPLCTYQELQAIGSVAPLYFLYLAQLVIMKLSLAGNPEMFDGFAKIMDRTFRPDIARSCLELVADLRTCCPEKLLLSVILEIHPRLKSQLGAEFLLGVPLHRYVAYTQRLYMETFE